MEQTEDFVMNFEAVKTSFRQTKDGYHLTLVLHPSDVPPDLFSSWVGTRYQCSIVQLNDENEPVMKTDSVEVNAMIQQAGMLCRSKRFQSWIHDYLRVDPEERDVWGESEEEHTARLLRQTCQIESRSELRSNPDAKRTFEEIYAAFMQSIEGK